MIHLLISDLLSNRNPIYWWLLHLITCGSLSVDVCYSRGVKQTASEEKVLWPNSSLALNRHLFSHLLLPHRWIWKHGANVISISIHIAIGVFHLCMMFTNSGLTIFCIYPWACQPSAAVTRLISTGFNQSTVLRGSRSQLWAWTLLLQPSRTPPFPHDCV